MGKGIEWTFLQGYTNDLKEYECSTSLIPEKWKSKPQ